MSLTKVTYSLIQGAPINILDYGATGDGVTDDSAAIRKALDAAGALPQGCEVIFPEGVYYIPTTVFIPTTRGITLTGYGATLKGAGQGTGTIFETGAEAYSTGGTSNWGFNETYIHYRQTIQGFNFTACEYAMRLWNMLNASAIRQNTGDSLKTFIYAKRCFYLDISLNRADSYTKGSGVVTDAIFRLESFNNVMNIVGNSCGNSQTGYYIADGTSGMMMSNNAAEGCTNGLYITGAVYGLQIFGWYLEANDLDINITSNGYKNGLIIDGCWFQSTAAIFADTWGSGELGKNNYYSGNGSVNLSDSLNSCHVWLPRSATTTNTTYTDLTIPANWTINGSCILHPQYSTYTGTPANLLAGLSENYLGNELVVPRHWKGTSSFGYELPFASVNTSVSGQATIITKIAYSTNESGIRFDFRVLDSLSTFPICGWISGTSVIRDDGQSPTVVASNNSGYYQLVLAGFTGTVQVLGGVRIV